MAVNRLPVNRLQIMGQARANNIGTIRHALVRIPFRSPDGTAVQQFSGRNDTVLGFTTDQGRSNRILWS